MKRTKKAFRELLNAKFEGTPNWRGNGNRGQRKRPYGDYLYSADREMFDFEYGHWLAGTGNWATDN